MGHSPFACLLSESSISIKMAAYEEEMPLASEIPIHPYTNVTWLIRISLHKALYIKIDQLCVTSPLSEKKPKARKSMLMSPCEMQQMICGGGRTKIIFYAGERLFSS